VIRYSRLTGRHRLFGVFFLIGMLMMALLGSRVSDLLLQRLYQTPMAQLEDKPPALQTLIPPLAEIEGQSVTQLQQQVQQQKAQQQAQAAAESERKRLTYSVPSQFQGKILQSAQLKLAKDAVALTFDDGPWDVTTAQVLEILAQANAKATFFWVGQAMQAQPEMAQRVVNAGHAIGNNTWHHRYKSMSPEEAASEIDTAAQIFREATGIETKLFRPPGGILDNGLVDYAISKGMTIVTWSVTSADTDSTSGWQSYANNVLSAIKPGGIVLMHDGGGDRSQTVKALPTIIQGLKDRGYRLVTVPELFRLESDGW